MPGNGYFDTSVGQYRPKSGDAWSDYSTWSTWTSWDTSPVLPLTFTTAVTDFGSSEVLNYTFKVDSNYPAYVDVKYSDSIDSAGALVSPTTISVSPNDTLSAAKGRYWQFVVSVDRDSASLELPYIASLSSNLTAETVQRSVTDIDTSNLSGSTGQRQLDNIAGVSTVTSAITQPHDEGASDPYVAASYVTDDYFVGTSQVVPLVFVDKSTSPLTLNIYNANDSFARVDCTIDAVVQGLPALSADAFGNITETL